MRGALQAFPAGLRVQGIIPADAGSTTDYYAWLLTQRDHPRGCGEHTRWSGRPSLTLGSSPRMRGAPCCSSGVVGCSGIIPADAGSTGLAIPYIPCSRDHPRGCGEHSAITPEAKANQGSSPRMRGARKRKLLVFGPAGIIPADAGSTPVTSVGTRWIGDHPRGCGEHCSHDISLSLFWGSSPRMRGARCG